MSVSLTRQQLEDLHRLFRGITDVLGQALDNPETDEPPAASSPPSYPPEKVRGKPEGRPVAGRLHDVQLPQKGGKSTKLFIVDEDGCGSTVYAGTFYFEPDDLLAYEGYDIEYTVKEIEKENGRFTALASWKPLV